LQDNIRALAAFIAAHLRPELVEGHGAEHRYSLAEHLNGTQTVPLQLASEPSASSCEMVRPTLHLKPQGADLHREISDKRFNALIYFQFCHSTCP
jgi:hypothetical protein